MIYIPVLLTYEVRHRTTRKYEQHTCLCRELGKEFPTIREHMKLHNINGSRPRIIKARAWGSTS